MRVSVTGGSKFIELFESIKSLNSKSCPLDNYEKILEVTKDIDVLVHTAFDHNYKNNISGIKNILKACEQNGVKKLIQFLSMNQMLKEYLMKTRLTQNSTTHIQKKKEKSSKR